MDIEGWMISVVVVIASVIGNIFVIKYMAAESKKDIMEIFSRLDKHGDDIIRLNTKSELAMTAKDVDDKYVSKEIFKQFEKHIDRRFDNLEVGQGKILSFIERTVHRRAE